MSRERIVKSSTCIIIGYSFRDEGINDIFDYFMKQGGKLVIISPDATDEFTKGFINKYRPNESSFSLLDDEVIVDGIDPLIGKIKSNIN